MSREGRSSRNRVSILSWMWTIVLACIPGVNIIAMFLLAFLSRKQPKRSFAVASLILMLAPTARPPPRDESIRLIWER